jgi:hypothetical protein
MMDISTKHYALIFEVHTTFFVTLNDAYHGTVEIDILPRHYGIFPSL